MFTKFQLIPFEKHERVSFKNLVFPRNALSVQDAFCSLRFLQQFGYGGRNLPFPELTHREVVDNGVLTTSARDRERDHQPLRNIVVFPGGHHPHGHDLARLRSSDQPCAQMVADRICRRQGGRELSGLDDFSPALLDSANKLTVKVRRITHRLPCANFGPSLRIYPWSTSGYWVREWFPHITMFLTSLTATWHFEAISANARLWSRRVRQEKFFAGMRLQQEDATRQFVSPGLPQPGPCTSPSHNFPGSSPYF